jgi:AsmA protein
MRKLLLAVVVACVVGAAGLFVWARTVLTSDTVRTTIASTLSTKLGQPVTIGGIGASIFPRISLNLDNVTIGKSGNISAGTLAVATDFSALLSRRIEHATVRLNAAHITLPLPMFTLPASAPTESSTAAPASSSGAGVTLVSVDEIVLNDVEVKSGGRTIRADIDLGVTGTQATVKKIELHADGTTVSITGTLTDYTAPAGTLTVQAGAMNVTDLVAFMTDFTKGLPASASGTGSAPATSAAGKMNLAVTLGADKATIGALTLDHLSGQARITDTAVTIDPARFNVFGGSYAGSLTLTLGDTPTFKVNATLTNVDMASVMTFAGQPGLVTGHMTGTLALDGRGLTAAGVIASAHGTAHTAITNGTIKGLGLVKGVVLATSMRGGSTSQATSASTTESFSSLDGTFTIANGAATTTDLKFTSNDVLLAVQGAVRLDGSSIALAGPMQLSDELSKQAGRDLVKYTQKDGRVTVPATVSGSADALHVGIDTGDLAKRAVTNAATDQAKKLLQRIGRGRGGGGS